MVEYQKIPKDFIFMQELIAKYAGFLYNKCTMRLGKVFVTWENVPINRIVICSLI